MSSSGPSQFAQPADDQAAIQVNIRILVVRAEGDAFRSRQQLEFAQLRQRFRLHDRPVKDLLVLEQPRRGTGVLITIGVTVQVVRREIQQHRDRRTKELNRLELK